MMARKYNILHLPLLSFFSKRLYRDVGQNWKGANMTYLFLLLAICWIPPTLSLRKDIIQALDSDSYQMQIINQVPDIHIEDGQVKVDQQEPLYIKRSDGTVAAIIDTTGSMNYIDDDGVVALLTETDLVIRSGKKQFSTLNLAKVSDFHFSKLIANQWIQMAKNSLVPFSYGIFLLLSYIFTVVLMLVVAFAGLILSAAMRSSLKFAGILRIAAAATTPSIILIATSIALKQAIPWPVYAVVMLLYLLLGIKACSKPAEEERAPTLKLTSLLDEEKLDEQHIHAA
ncbi:MAG: DUF1189 family protein [Verrucomicrobiota bacterium]